MKKEEIMKNVSATFSKVSVKLKKHSPEILVVAGVVGTVASAVMACHATTKLDSVLEKSKKDIDAIHKCAENEELAAEYSKDDAKKDLAIVYAQAGVKSLSSMLLLLRLEPYPSRVLLRLTIFSRREM